MSVVSHVWQTPVRQDQRTGTSQASASSRRLENLSLQGILRLLRANSIVGPVPASPAGGCGGRAGVAAIPGVSPVAGPNGSVWMCDAARPIAASPALMSSMNPAGPHR